MNTLDEAARDFLAQKSIAVAGVSRSGELPANYIYRRLKESGHVVYAINPRADEVEGDRCYHSVAELPELVGGLVIATPPDAACQLVANAAERGVRRVWMHQSLFGHGSLDDDAVESCREHHIAVIPGSCPMMFIEPVDVPHKCIHFLAHVVGREPTDDDMHRYFYDLTGALGPAVSLDPQTSVDA